MPLDDVTVVALEQAVAAPFASRQLADHGARVIKIERPGTGDFARAYDTRANGLASYFVWLNRGKESLTLDLKQAAGKELLTKLLAGADVFLSNLAPGAVERLGFGATTIRQRYPRLVVCEVSGYGVGGPDEQRKAYDLLVQAEAGLMSVTGTDEQPSKVGISVADISAGMYAFSGVLTALLQRARSGAGTVVRVALLDTLAEWMSQPVYYAGADSEPPRRSGAEHATIAPYGPFLCADGQVFLGVQNEREWAVFCDRVLGDATLAADPDFVDNSARVANRGRLQEIVEAVLCERTVTDVLTQLDATGIASARMRSVRELVDHPQLRARDRWRQIHSPVGPLPALLPPVIMEGVEPVMGPVPDVGEQTEQILRELRLDDVTISQLRRRRVI